jgi:hypothetical protein
MLPEQTRVSIRTYKDGFLRSEIRNPDGYGWKSGQARPPVPPAWEKTAIRLVMIVLVMIMVVVSVAVPPRPVFFLFSGGQPAEITVRVSVVFPRPGVVVGHLFIVPDVVIAVVGIVDTVVVMVGASPAYYGAPQRGGQTP